MKLTKIKLKDYKQYHGLQKIEVPNEDKIVIVKGENGAGKTNLLNGLTWVFYNVEDRDNKKLFNDNVIYTLEKDEEANMYIEVHFKQKNKFHILKREIVAKKDEFNQYIFNEYHNLDIINDGETESIEDNIEIESYINNILNYSVKDYFFFDGSKIEQFTKENHNEDVKKAIKNLLKIEAIKRAKGHINKIIDDIRRSISDKNLDSKLDDLNNKIDNLRYEIESKQTKKDNFKKNINDLQKNIENTLDELDHIEKNSNYKEQKEKYSSKFHKTKEELKTKKEKLNTYLNNSYILFTENLFKDAKKYIDNKIKNEQDKIPGNIYKLIIRESISEEECVVCEQSLNEDKISELYNKLPNIKVEESTIQSLKSLNTKLENSNIKRKEILQNIAELKSEIIDLEENKEHYKSLVDDYDDKINNEMPDAKKLREMLEKFQEEKEKTQEKLFEIKHEIKNCNKELKDLEKQHKEISKKSEENEFKNKKLDKSYEIREELQRIFNNYEKNEIKKINKKTKEIFDSIIRKEDVFKKVFIDDDYNLNVQRSYDENIVTELSYGERQILSLSLILSLAIVSEEVGAFMMDTPMGNLDPIHRRKLMKNMPDFLDQLFLLVTSSEFTSDLYEICQDFITYQYRLKTLSNGNTQIIKEEIN